jgi:hypothetical protein
MIVRGSRPPQSPIPLTIMDQGEFLRTEHMPHRRLAWVARVRRDAKEPLSASRACPKELLANRRKDTQDFCGHEVGLVLLDLMPARHDDLVRLWA